jgi:putative photosynthetic complex assembly protein
MSETFRQPALRHDADKDMIPVGLVRAMFGLAFVSLVIVSAAVVSGREPVGQPKAAPILQERQLILEGGGAKAVKVREADGTLIADLAHGGFITVIQNGLGRERFKQGVDPMLPVRLVQYENGRLTLHDPETGWSAELHAFGADNKAAFERLLAD